jgi:hypothetical protein
MFDESLKSTLQKLLRNFPFYVIFVVILSITFPSLEWIMSAGLGILTLLIWIKHKRVSDAAFYSVVNCLSFADMEDENSKISEKEFNDIKNVIYFIDRSFPSLNAFNITFLVAMSIVIEAILLHFHQYYLLATSLMYLLSILGFIIVSGDAKKSYRMALACFSLSVDDADVKNQKFNVEKRKVLSEVLLEE